jgi:hypothetical protein
MGVLMREILSPEILADLQAHYLSSVRAAELAYPEGSRDNDALTATLGTALALSGDSFSCEYRNLGGESAGATGIFQVEVLNAAGSVVFRKGLLFQTTVQWAGRDPVLVERARTLDGNFRRSVVIDYSAEGYHAASIAHVLAANGDRRRMRHRMRKLDEILGIDFVHCRMGLTGLYWDVQKATLMDPAGSGPDLRVKHVLSTVVHGPELAASKFPNPLRPIN